MRTRVAGPRLTVYRPGAAGGFSPSDITGLAAWYDASNAASITSSSGAVSQWSDLSGNGNHLTQGTGSAQPVTGTRTLNSLNVLDFNADYLTLSAFGVGTLAQPNTVFVVLDADSIGGGTDRDFFDGFGSSNRNHLGFASTGPKQRYYAGTVQDVGTPSTGAQQWSCLFNGASSGLWVNGASVSSANPGTDSLAGLCIGSFNSGAAAPYLGAIAEIVVYNASLSTTDRQTVEAYLKAKWGTP